MWFDGTNRYVRMSALWLPRWANMCLPRDGKTCGFAVDTLLVELRFEAAEVYGASKMCVFACLGWMFALRGSKG